MVVYRDLRDAEIRVIRVYTEQDDPKYATGPVYCSLEYVSLEDLNQYTNNGKANLFKGYSWTWPCSPLQGVENLFGSRDRLFRKSFMKLSSSHAGMNDNGSSSPESSNKDDDSNGEDAQLPWRFKWGDYVALSYVWGDATICRTVFVDGMPMAVTQNLEAALCQLRSYHRIKQGFRVWADAICINQADLDERAKQVAKMKQIYNSAWHVVIWLGPTSNDSDLAMAAIRYFSRRSLDDKPLDEVYHRVEMFIVNLPHFRWRHTHIYVAMQVAVFQALWHLLARPYFQRLWVLQEVASGSLNTPVLCGTSCVLLDDVYRTLQLIRDVDGSELGTRIIDSSSKGSSGMYRAWDQLPAGSDGYTRSEKLWERPIAMIEAQSISQKPVKSSSMFHSSIFGALTLSREAKASDERDRVYGILGFPCLARSITLSPDYHLNAIQIYTLFAKSLFRSGDLNGLRLVASPVSRIYTKYFKPYIVSRPRKPKFARCPELVNAGCQHNLPSWIPCWSCPRNPAVNIPSHTSIALQAFYTQPSFLGDERMTVRGMLFDTINSLSAFHSLESDSSYPFNGPTTQSIYGNAANTLEAFWRTIVANTTRSGGDPPSSWSLITDPLIWEVGGPATADQREMFNLLDFYIRNKSLRLFDKTLAQLLRQEEVGTTKRIQSLVEKLNRSIVDHRAAYWRTRSAQRQTRRSGILWAMQVLAWRRLITTNKGYLGLAPAAAIAGDWVAVIPGCDVPLVLRSEGDCFRVLGESYVHGVTMGDMARMLERGEQNLVNITLC